MNEQGQVNLPLAMNQDVKQFVRYLASTTPSKVFKNCANKNLDTIIETMRHSVPREWYVGELHPGFSN